MPRCFFNVIDGSRVRGLDVTVLPSIYVAQAEAIRMAGETLLDTGGCFWNGTECWLDVADAQGQVLFVLRFSAEEQLPEPGSESDPHRVLGRTLPGTGGGSCGERLYRSGSVGPLRSSRCR